MAAQSQHRSSHDIYNSRLGHFTSWCSERDLDPTQAPLISVADFFMHLFQSGLQVATFRNYCSAITRGSPMALRFPLTMRFIISSVGCLFSDLRLSG